MAEFTLPPRRRICPTCHGSGHVSKEPQLAGLIDQAGIAEPQSALAKDWDSPEDAIYDANQHTDTTGVTVTHWSSNG